MNNKKEYSKSLDERTRDSKNRIIEHLTPHYNVELKEEDKSTKLFCKDKNTGETLFKIELELRFSWRGVDFPYETVTIPYRKKKFLEDDIQIFYVVMNEFGNQIITTKKQNILDSPSIQKSTMYTVDEKFFEVDLDKFVVGYESLIDYIEDNIEEDYESEEVQFNYIRCPNCEIVQRLKYKRGLLCPICDHRLFN